MSDDTIITIERFVNIFISLYTALIIIQIILSFVTLPYGIWTYRFRNFVDETVTPYLRLFRRILPMAGPLDLSPMVAIFSLVILRSILFQILESFAS